MARLLVILFGGGIQTDDRRVQRWVVSRSGSLDGWSRVPRKAQLDSASGNQQVAAAAVADAGRGRSGLARRRTDGNVEVATYVKGNVAIRAIDPEGRVLDVRTVKQRSAAPTVGALLIAAALVVYAIVEEGPRARAGACTAALAVVLAFVLAPSLSDAVPDDDDGTWSSIETDEPGE